MFEGKGSKWPKRQYHTLTRRSGSLIVFYNLKLLSRCGICNITPLSRYESRSNGIGWNSIAFLRILCHCMMIIMIILMMNWRCGALRAIVSRTRHRQRLEIDKRRDDVVGRRGSNNHGVGQWRSALLRMLGPGKNGIGERKQSHGALVNEWDIPLLLADWVCCH